jgi:hypothetical protein
MSGVSYTEAQTSKPSDSFPGLMSIMTGASPRTMGVNYDVAYDRVLNPPAQDTGNGLFAGPCTKGATPSGTSTEYEEGINFNNAPGVAGQNLLNGGAPSGDGGINSIDPTRLIRDKNCDPVYPWNFIRVNTVYGVIHAAGGYTAWSDKHPAYSSVGGPSGTSSDSNLDEYYSPEINSDSSNFNVAATPQLVTLPECLSAGKPTLPDTVPPSNGDDYTRSFLNVQCYDGLKVNAVINEIKGMNHDGTAPKPVPSILGMNFQAVSIGQKLIYQYLSSPGPGYSVFGGYTDSIGTPSASLKNEIMYVDGEIGRMVSALDSQHKLDSTLIIITAKHGQSPVDTSRYNPDGKPNDPASILDAFLPASESQSGGQIGPTEDDVALLWLTDPSAANVAAAVAKLKTTSPTFPLASNIAGIGEIFSGPSIGLYWNIGDSRTPDILVTPNIGVTYSNSGAKEAEHGGFAKDDVNVMLLLSNPHFHSSTVTFPVETAQVAPTLLKALGLDPGELQAVQIEHTQVLPWLHFGD